MDDGAAQFIRHWWSKKDTTFFPNRWLGVPCWQNPCDVWSVQEIISDTRPDVIVETGTFAGGSAVLWATLLAMFGNGRVISIDVSEARHEMANDLPIVKERVEFITGSSTDPMVAEEVRRESEGQRVMVILDSDHAEDHVLRELDVWGSLVTPGCYMVVEDGFVTYAESDYGGGPLEATLKWLPLHPEFEADRSRERMLFTFCPSGFLRRLDQPGEPA
jgi:cephalosporin hydroxylase